MAIVARGHDMSVLRRLIERCARWMVFALLGCVLMPTARAEERVALVIGNASYRELPLDNPLNDAADMAAALEQAGFRVILRRDADARMMRQAVREFATELRRADVGLFYYAGHGVQLGGTNYLLPVGTDIRSEADAEDLSLDVNYVLRTMEESQARVRLVILDACRNNPYPRSFRSAARGLAALTATRGSLIAFATAPGELAADGTGRNGMYTKHLLASLREPDTEALRVFQRTRAAVVRETAGRQTPWESTSLLGEFHFRSATAVAASTTASAVTADATNDRAYWDAVKDSRNPAELKAYLEQFPNGTFAGLARARLRTLEPAAAERTASPAAPAAPGGLSYGGVTSQVQKHRTTQLDLVQMFGGPNISTTDGEGNEVWVYERAVTETERQSRSEGWQAAANLGLFFSAVQIGGGGSTGRSSSSASTSTSFRALTVIVKFNPDKTVKEYSVRASQF
jgi:uncharacterized caspase-like protein